jgi:hypothetical protein
VDESIRTEASMLIQLQENVSFIRALTVASNNSDKKKKLERIQIPLLAGCGRPGSNPLIQEVHKMEGNTSI